MRTVLGLCVASLLLCLTACQPKSADSSSSTATNAATASSSGSSSGSKYDSGPRAGEQPVDDARVEIGEQLFKDKGCSACHAFGHKLTGPDLDGVTMRRTAQWMENQILHPEVMTKEDPISHGLLAQYAVQMPNQKLTPDEARSVIEYLKHQNHEVAEKH
jgi:mono/diheme cytochrome c family protein